MTDKPKANPRTHLIHLEERKVQGARIFSPTAARNSAPIAAVLAKVLLGGSKVLEIGSGTGEHAVAFCKSRPDIKWQPSDPDLASRLSISDWRLDAPASILEPLNIDVMAKNWWQRLSGFTAIYSANMIHIAPPEALMGLAKGAGEVLNSGDLVILYGPFLFAAKSHESNLKFDARLKQKSPDWGVRELDFVKDIFADSGLGFKSKIDMPANNHIVIFVKS